ncbi:MAG TPA: MFS transporter [Burkholderiaceae bacterium]|nr:MFS transporter [Burkholderiaceae bacterium]
MTATASGPARSEPGLIALLSLGAFGSAASMRVLDAQLPALARDFELSLAGVAQAITVFSVAYGVLQLAYGPIGDRFGKWRVIASAVFASGLTSALCAAAPSFGVLLIARALAGATCAAIIPLSMAWVGDAVAYERRQPVLARFLTGQILGMALGQWLGGVASDYANWRVPFAVLALCFFAAGALLWRARGAAAQTAPVVPRSGHPWHEARYVVRQRWARVVLATVFIEGTVLFGALAFLATHLHLRYGVSLTHAGSIATFYAVGGLLFAIASRRLVARLGEAGLARGGGVLLLVGLFAVTLSPVWWTAPAACALAGLGFYMLHNTLQTNATQMAPDARGAAVSMFASAFFLGQTAGVALASLAVASVGTLPVISSAAVAVFALALAFGAMRARRVAR